MKNTAQKTSVLIDLNVLLDVLQKREQFYNASYAVLQQVEKEILIGYIAAHSLTTLWYLLRKDGNIPVARGVLTDILNIFKVAAIDESVIKLASSLEYDDFEDAVQMAAAAQCGAQVLISRDTSGYIKQLVPVMKPADFIAAIH